MARKKRIKMTGCPRCGALWGRKSGFMCCTKCNYMPEAEGRIMEHYSPVTGRDQTRLSKPIKDEPTMDVLRHKDPKGRGGLRLKE